MKFTAYPSYKPSGLEWLGQVPEHWELKRLKTAVELIDKKVEADEDNPVPYIGLENIESLTGRLMPLDPDVVPTGTANEFKVGSTLFGKLRPYLAKACTPDFEGLCSTELLVLEGRTLNSRALLYLLLSSGFIDLVDSSTYGSKMPRTNWSFVGDCIVPIASPDEQRALADFLDRETAKIDTLVAKKRTLIERLKEKRTALISRTVTRGLPPDTATQVGLDPHPKLKPSGVDWLGEVPEHWEIIALKWRARCKSGDGISADDVVASGDQETIPVIGGNGLMGFTKQPNVLEPVLVIGRVGALCGNVHQVSTPARVTDNALILRSDDRAYDRRYLAAVLRSRNLNEIADKTAQPLITGTQVRDQRLPWPPLAEQAILADFIDGESAKIDQMTAEVKAAVERLQEYRTALITAAVTGKIDVREMAEPGVAIRDSVPDVVRRSPSGGTSTDAGHAGGRA